MKLEIKNDWKIFTSEDFNYKFNMNSGYMETWGKTFEDNPDFSPYGPTIWDAEVSEQCHGVNNVPCPFCYKSNVGSSGRNMSFETFVEVFNKLPHYNGIPFVTQVAFGIGDIDANSSLWDMMKYCREHFVIPNVTINGDRLTDEIVNKLTNLCGGISVSCYSDKNVCFDAIDRLNKAGCKVVNIHQMVSSETKNRCFELLVDYELDKRLKNLNAIVFLALKQKGRGEKFTPLSQDYWNSLVNIAYKRNIPIGFDSCSANKVAEAFTAINKLNLVEQYIEPCESAALSFYTNVEGKFFPCSFAEDVTSGISVLDIEDFFTDLWNFKSTCIERKRILDNGRSCPYFQV